MPSVAPSDSPSEHPIAAPGGQYDCSDSCAFLTDGALPVSENYALATVSLSSHFKIQFDYTNPADGRAYPSVSNIFDLQEVVTGRSLVSVSVTFDMHTWLTYDGNDVYQNGPYLVNNYQTEYTTLTVEISAGTITLVSSANLGWVATAPISVVGTANALYTLYFSNPSINSDHLSAGGSVKNVFITGRLITLNSGSYVCLLCSLLFRVRKLPHISAGRLSY